MNNERMIAVSSGLIERAVSLLDLLPESGTIIELRAALATQPAAGEPEATWVALTAAGQLRKGDKIRFRFGEETLTETVALVLDAGTEREEIVYNRKRNFYFITSKALAGTSSAKEVEVLRTVSAPPAAAHGDEAVRENATESAIQRACKELPEGWSMQIELERGAGDVTLFNAWDIVVDFGQDFESSISEQVEAAIDAAMRAQGDGGAA